MYVIYESFAIRKKINLHVKIYINQIYECKNIHNLFFIPLFIIYLYNMSLFYIILHLYLNSF